jgi:hypothetical protein
MSEGFYRSTSTRVVCLRSWWTKRVLGRRRHRTREPAAPLRVTTLSYTSTCEWCCIAIGVVIGKCIKQSLGSLCRRKGYLSPVASSLAHPRRLPRRRLSRLSRGGDYCGVFLHYPSKLFSNSARSRSPDHAGIIFYLPASVPPKRPSLSRPKVTPPPPAGVVPH